MEPTGNLGSAAVAVGLVMGASRVVAVGRNATVLADLERRFGPRCRTVGLTGEADTDAAAMRGAAGGGADVVLDLMPPEVGADVVRRAVMTVRQGGRVVLMGGVGMLGGDDLALPYPWLMRNDITIRGQWMGPRESIGRLVSLARAGLLDLAHEDVTTFALDAVNEAVAHAAVHGGPFVRTIITPQPAA